MLSDADAENLDVLRRVLGDRLIGEILPAESPQAVDPKHAGLDTVLALARAGSAGDARSA